MVDLSRHVNTWCHVVFENGTEADGRIELLGDGFGFVSPLGTAAVPIRPEDVAEVAPAEQRPVVQVPPEPGKRIRAEADLREFLGRQVRIYWDDATTSEGRLEYSMLVSGRLALVTQSPRMNEGEQAQTIHWERIDRVLGL